MIISCPICSDSFNPTSNLVVTPCGHIFHFECVLQWFERSKSCPQCRKATESKKLVRLYLNVTSLDDSREDPVRLNETIDNLQLQIRGKDKELNILVSKTKDMENTIEVLRVENSNLNDQTIALESQASALRRCVKNSKTLEAELKNLRQQKNKVDHELHTLKNVNVVLHGTVSEADEAMMLQCDDSESSKSLITFSSALKRELVKMTEKLQTSNKEVEKVRNTLQLTKQHLKSQHDEQLKQLHGEIEILRISNENLKKKLKNMQDSLASPSSGSAKDKVLSRLLHESPMPEEFCIPKKRQLEITQPESPELIVLSSPETSSLKHPRISSDSVIELPEDRQSTVQQDVFKKHLTTSKSVPSSTIASRQPLSTKNSYSKPGLSKTVSVNSLGTKKKILAPQTGVKTFEKSRSTLFEPTRTSKMGSGGDSLFKRLYDASHAPAAGMVFNGLGGTVKAEETIRPKKMSSFYK